MSPLCPACAPQFSRVPCLPFVMLVFHNLLVCRAWSMRLCDVVTMQDENRCCGIHWLVMVYIAYGV